MALVLDDTQLEQFNKEGWLFFEDVFQTNEVELLKREAHRIFAMANIRWASRFRSSTSFVWKTSSKKSQPSLLNCSSWVSSSTSAIASSSN